MNISSVHAALTWARMCEPTDRVAAAFISELGQGDGLKLAHELMALPNIVEKQVARFDQLEELGAPTVSKHLKRWVQKLPQVDPESDLRQARLLGADVLNPESARWPHLVNDLGPSAPFALWVRGDLEALNTRRRAVAVVGSRAATPYGEHATSVVLSALAPHSDVVVSGGAFGVDASAHRQALARGLPSVAVMAGGVDRLYPAGNHEILSRLANGEHCSAVVSESPPGTLPMKSRFLTRNRLIAALSHATVVVEAAWRSGSLSTAHHAFAIGREVGAIPGPITSAQSAGCHRLMQECGAQVITCTQDVDQLLGALTAGGPAEPNGRFLGALAQDRPDVACSITSGALRVLDGFTRHGAQTSSELALRTGLLEPEVMGFLGELEMAGAVVRNLFGWSRNT